MANKLAPQFAKETDLFKTNEVILSGNFSTGQVYTREPSVFANNIAEELGIESLKDKSIGEEQGDIPIWYSIGNGQGVVMYASNGSIAVNDTNNAFNRPFGGTGTESTVARSDHSHDQFSGNIQYVYTEIFTPTSTTKTISSGDVLSSAPASATHVNPAIGIELFIFDGTSTNLIDIATNSAVVVRGVDTVAGGLDHYLTEVQLKSLSTSSKYIVKISFTTGKLRETTGGGV